MELEGIDGTAGGPDADDAAPNGCISLEALATVQLTLDEARSSEDWDLCFRRDVITVNGELGGPGNVEAIDLDEAATDTETLEDVQGRSASSEEAHFDDVGVATLDDPGLAWRGDRVISRAEWVGIMAPAPVPAQEGIHARIDGKLKATTVRVAPCLTRSDGLEHILRAC